MEESAPAFGGGLGNFKGVMLCTRPGPTESGPKPFVAASAPGVGDPIWLQPSKKLPLVDAQAVKMRGPSAALRRHCQWIKELQGQVKEEQRSAEETAKAAEIQKQKLKEAHARQREAISDIKISGHKESLSDDIAACLRPKVKRPVAAKPLWAMTENEREDFEDGEAENLINFAEGLDYDEFIRDLEFRQCLQAVRDRAKKLQREQDAFKESLIREFNSEAAGSDDGNDEEPVGTVRRSNGKAPGDRPEWDASTAGGDEAQNDEARSIAEKVWKEARALRGVHSKHSVQKLIERKLEGGLDADAQVNSQ